eukprot:CAMPEP_0172539160 /NCGR_PEP_ID=MMETSP1067-20121228/10411_1 /TAXON_ID=265564 ORGANISM="Thalassiosira punctigera, Strain Tpunct2005C2" /NCGR_SAMPLE_ID=MMETSP1067 /ASSEMBLY_ACC=CAM_ASM_000444 /LENGTH=662 /DNA_ID=CAMNT_0013324799 /DNA_START=131 /DNA_END=2119 /DNA_ORIENTATION=+
MNCFTSITKSIPLSQPCPAGETSKWAKILSFAASMGLFLTGMNAEQGEYSSFELNIHESRTVDSLPPVPKNAGCGLIFFYHVNKVGGRTVQEHLRESTHEYLQLFPNERDWSQALHEIESFLKFDDAIVNIAGDGSWWKTLEIHHGFPGLLFLQQDNRTSDWEKTVTSQGCAFKKVTLLRNPIERLVSNIKWNNVQQDILPMYIRETSNWMTRHLAFNTCNEKLICRWKRRTGFSNSPHMLDKHFLSLIDVLDTFDVVGVMEDLQSFVDDVLGRPVSLISTHQQSYSDGRPYPLTASMYRDVVKKNLYDFRLYWRYAPSVMPLAIERGETMTYEKMRQYYIRNKPVLVKNAAPFLFKNHEDFSSEYVRKNVDPSMKILASHETGRLLIGDLDTTLPKCMDMPDRCVYFKKSKFSYTDLNDEIITKDDDPLRTTLLSGLNRSSFAWKSPNRGIYNIYVSTHGGALPHHHPQRFNLLMEGRKRWIIVDPTTYANSSQLRNFELEDNTGVSVNRKRIRQNVTVNTYKPQDWFQDVISKWVEIPHYDFVQEAGDLFFLPDKFTHGTVDLTRHTIGVIFKGEMTQADTEELSFKHLFKYNDHLPWRHQNNTGDSMKLKNHQLPSSPLLNTIPATQKFEKHLVRKVAGGTAKYFSNRNLDYKYSQKPN